MEAGQQKLNDLAQQLRDLAKSGSPDAQQKMADLARQIQDLKKQLEDAADKQQESGTAAGAERLNHLAKAILDQKVAPDLADMAKTGLDANRATTDADNARKSIRPRSRQFDQFAGKESRESGSPRAASRRIASYSSGTDRNVARTKSSAGKVGRSTRSRSTAWSEPSSKPAARPGSATRRAKRARPATRSGPRARSGRRPRSGTG